MSRARLMLQLIDNPQQVASAPAPQDAPLIHLLVTLAMSDGVLEEDELALLRRVCPHLDDEGVRHLVRDLSQRPLDMGELLDVFADAQDRSVILRIAARMICLDGGVAMMERAELAMLARSFGLPPESVEQVVQEVVAEGGAVERGQLLAAVRNMLWDRLEPSREPPVGSLAAVLPHDSELICTVSLQDQPVAAVTLQGLAGQFECRAAFLPWDQIQAYTRVPVPGAAFHLQTPQGTFAMRRPELRDIGALLDFVYGRTPVPSAGLGSFQQV